jgi:hypothetical protein
MGILTGDFETFDPDQRADGDRVYYRYRKVLATFINRSGGVVHVRTFTNGYFEDTGPEGGTKERRQLIREAREASGPGAMTKLDKLFDLSDLVDDARFDEVVLSRIHPLELDEQRHVVKQGYINTQNLPTFFDLYNTPQGQGNVL